VPLFLPDDVVHAPLQMPLVEHRSNASGLEAAWQPEAVPQGDLHASSELAGPRARARHQCVRVRVDDVEREQPVARPDLQERARGNPALFGGRRDDPAVLQAHGDVLRDRLATRDAKQPRGDAASTRGPFPP
jgi:hypothetical protein